MQVGNDVSSIGSSSETGRPVMPACIFNMIVHHAFTIVHSWTLALRACERRLNDIDILMDTEHVRHHSPVF